MTMTIAEGAATIPSPNPDKTTKPKQLHNRWLDGLPNGTIIIYTDGSKRENGAVGCGWVIYHSGDPRLHCLTEGRYHLGNRAKVYDAELHAVQEVVTTLLTSSTPLTTVFIYIDNQAAFDTLRFNKNNHKYVQRSLKIIETLQLLGWKLFTMWCPSHCNIRCNERADTLAKLGASFKTPCEFATTTKTWLLTQVRTEFLTH